MSKRASSSNGDGVKPKFTLVGFRYVQVDDPAVKDLIRSAREVRKAADHPPLTFHSSGMASATAQ